LQICVPTNASCKELILLDEGCCGSFDDFIYTGQLGETEHFNKTGIGRFSAHRFGDSWLDEDVSYCGNNKLVSDIPGLNFGSETSLFGRSYSTISLRVWVNDFSSIEYPEAAVSWFIRDFESTTIFDEWKGVDYSDPATSFALNQTLYVKMVDSSICNQTLVVSDIRGNLSGKLALEIVVGRIVFFEPGFGWIPDARYEWSLSNSSEFFVEVDLCDFLQ